MGRILYGVMGDAWGHVMPSLAIARRLKDHEIVFVGGGHVNALAQYGYSVVPAPIIGTELSRHSVDTISTVLSGLASLRKRPSVIARLTAVIREFDPDLIITDYEHFLPLAARRLGRACISVDHIHIVTHCRYQQPPGHRISRLMTAASVRTMYSSASHYLIYSFAKMDPIDPTTTEMFWPVLREELDLVRPSEGEHALVYMRGTSLTWLRALLAGRKRRFVIYGFPMDREEGNLVFRNHSVEGFLADLAGCSYVVSNAGNALISESLHYGKPLLCFPIALFYEQLLNAYLLANAGFGVYHEANSGAAVALEDFEILLPEFRKNIANAASVDRGAIIARLRELIASRGAIGRQCSGLPPTYRDRR